MNEKCTDQKNHLDIYLKIHYYANHGKSLYVIGNISVLGNWKPRKALQLSWNPDNWWSVHVQLPRFERDKVEYKYLVNDTYVTEHSSPQWEPGPNRIISQYTLQECEMIREYFTSDIWAFRTIKLKLNYTIPSDKYSMYIIGNIPELGNHHTPMKMFQKTAKDIISGELVQQWHYSVVVNPEKFNFHYYYVMKNEEDNTMIWERGAGRSLKSEDLESFRCVEDEFIGTPAKVKIQMFHFFQTNNNIHKHEKNQKQLQQNGTFQRRQSDLLTPKARKAQHVQKRKDGYTFNNTKSLSFFYYEKFGRINKLDWNFVLNFHFDRINENIIIGPYPQNELDIIQLQQQGIKAVLNLQTQFDFFHRGINMDDIKKLYQQYGIHLVNHEILDMDPDDFIRRGHKGAKILKKLVNQFEQVYVHCTAGIGRAPSTVVLYLCASLEYNLEDAVNLVKKCRPSFYIHYRMLIQALEKTNILNGNYEYINKNF